MHRDDVPTKSKLRLWGCWLLLLTGFGAILQFAILCTMEDLPSAREWFVWLWPLSGIVFALLGARFLRHYYWVEAPPELRPKFALTDLVVVLLWTGLLGAGLQHWTESHVFPFVFLLSALVSDSCLLIGFAAASRERQRSLARRILLAASVFGIMYGVMAVLGFAVLLIIAAFAGHADDVPEVVVEVFFGGGPHIDPFTIVMRAGALAGIVGGLIFSLLSGSRREPEVHS